MARTILIWAPTGIATPTCKLMLESTPLVLAETITLTEHATIKRAYTGTVTAAAANYFYNFLSAGAFIGGGTVVIGGTDGLTYIADGMAAQASDYTAARAALIDNLDATISGTPASVWSYATRTLTQSAASVTAAVTGSNITAYRGTKWSIALTDIGALTGWTKLYFTVRTLEENAEALSLCQIKLTSPGAGTDGLLIFNASTTVTAANGSITVDDAPTGDITVVVAAAATTSAPTGVFYYDVKMITASNVVIKTIGGTFTVLPDITRQVS